MEPQLGLANAFNSRQIGDVGRMVKTSTLDPTAPQPPRVAPVSIRPTPNLPKIKDLQPPAERVGVAAMRARQRPGDVLVLA